MLTYGLIIVGFIALILVVGVILSKRVDTADDWAVAGRSLGVIPLAGTFVATIASSVSVIGFIGYYYRLGWGGFFNLMGTVGTCIVFGVWFAGRIRRYGKVTLPDYMEDRFGPKTAAISAIMVIVSNIALLVAQLVGMASLLDTLFGLNKWISILIMGIIFISFTAIGGMVSVAYTDTICGIVMIIGCWIMMFVLLGKVGGFESLHVALAETSPKHLDPFSGGDMQMGMIISWLLVYSVGNMGSAQYLTRFYSAKNEDVARKSVYVACPAFIILYIPMMIIGLCGFILIPGITGDNNVTPTLLYQLMPNVVIGIMASSMLMAAISTADSVLLIAGTTFARDFYQRHMNPKADSKKILKISRVSTLVIGLVAMAMSLTISTSVMWIQTNMQNILSSTLAIAVMLGFTIKRVNAKGAAVGMICGGATALIWFYLDQPLGVMPTIPGILVCTVVMLVVSYLTPAPPADVVERFFGESQFEEGDNEIIQQIMAEKQAAK
jgi:SSS family transporter